MDFWSIYAASSIFLSIVTCAPTENSISEANSTSTLTESTTCTPIPCPGISCPIGYKSIYVPCSCPKCVPEHDSSITTISLSTKSDGHSRTDNQNLSTTLGFPRHVCRFACKVETCKEGEILVRDPTLLCSCPRCEHIQSTTEELTTADPSTLDKSSTENLPSTQCELHCPLITCTTSERLEQMPGQCECPKCVPIENIKFTREIPIECKFVCKIPSCPPGEILYHDPSVRCSCPYCTPESTLAISRPPIQCKIACPALDCPPGETSYRDPSVLCGCPKCVPIHCPIACPEIYCPYGEKLFKNTSDICACPKCIEDPQTPTPIRTPRLTYECKVTCPDYVCPPGQRLERDPHDGCSCPRCVPDVPYIPESHCELICPQIRCLDGEVVVREARECSCPRCECIRPPVCPAVTCAGIWKYPSCGCPICLVTYDIDTY